MWAVALVAAGAFCAPPAPVSQASGPRVAYAGVRSSAYGIKPFPEPAEWEKWSRLPEPPRTLGQAIAARIEQTCGIIWVDFTLRDVLPLK